MGATTGAPPIIAWQPEPVAGPSTVGCHFVNTGDPGGSDRAAGSSRAGDRREWAVLGFRLLQDRLHEWFAHQTRRYNFSPIDGRGAPEVVEVLIEPAVDAILDAVQGRLPGPAVARR